MCKTVLSDKLTPEQEACIFDGFARHNAPFAGPGHRESVCLVVNDEAGNLLGALEAVVFYNWMSINRLWVKESVRGTGMGVQLMQEAQGIAVDKGCVGCYLNTFDFQARGFYEKLGYSVFGQIPDCPVGHQRFFMQKIVNPKLQSGKF